MKTKQVDAVAREVRDKLLRAASCADKRRAQELAHEAACVFSAENLIVCAADRVAPFDEAVAPSAPTNAAPRHGSCFQAKYQGHCTICRGAIERGEPAAFLRGGKALAHAACAERP